MPDELICYVDLLNRAFYEFYQHKIVIDVTKMRIYLFLPDLKNKIYLSKSSMKHTIWLYEGRLHFIFKQLSSLIYCALFGY